MNHEELFNQLLNSENLIYKNNLATVPREQGAYILWLNEKPRVCLKTGIAGPRKGDGLWGRLKRHFACSSILGKHMVADKTSPWQKNYDFSKNEQCRKFLAEKCYFQVIELPDLTRSNLEDFENFIELKLKPRYAGRIRA